MPTTPHFSRRDSWPPTQVPISSIESYSSFPPIAEDCNSSDIMDTDMDSNPISFFLSSPSDPSYDDDLIDIDLSAGIEGSPSSSAYLPQDIREVSPSSLQRVNQRPEDDFTGAELERKRRRDRFRDREIERQKAEEEMTAWLAAPLSLRDFTSSQSSKRKSTNRGRGIVRLSPTSSSRATARGSARRRASSYSSPRPHSWREPSPEIGSIQEEDEEYQDAVMKMDIGEEDGQREETPGLMSDTLTDGEEPEVRRKKAKVEGRIEGKGKGKRVRWAMPERWDID